MKNSLCRYSLLFFVFLIVYFSLFIPVAEARGPACYVCNQGMYIKHEDGMPKVVDKQQRYRNGKHEIRFQKEIVLLKCIVLSILKDMNQVVVIGQNGK